MNVSPSVEDALLDPLLTTMAYYLRLLLSFLGSVCRRKAICTRVIRLANCAVVRLCPHSVYEVSYV